LATKRYALCVAAETVPNTVLKTVRMELRLSQDELARAVRDAGKRLREPNDCSKRQIARWESGLVAAPRAVYVRALEEVTGKPIEALGFRDAAERYGADDLRTDEPSEMSLLSGSVPHSFTAETLAGYWVTTYDFQHDGKPQYHADVARIVAESDRWVRIANHPPEPRSQGRARPFRNEIEAQLANRHLVGHWRNTSDTRYFGSLHLAIHPGETMMEGFYTGFGSDIAVSFGNWKWVRLDQASIPESAALTNVTLREPAEIHDLVMKRTQNDALLALSDIGEGI